MQINCEVFEFVSLSWENLFWHRCTWHLGVAASDFNGLLSTTLILLSFLFVNISASTSHGVPKRCFYQKDFFFSSWEMKSNFLMISPRSDPPTPRKSFFFFLKEALPSFPISSRRVVSPLHRLRRRWRRLSACSKGDNTLFTVTCRWRGYPRMPS